MQTASFKPDAYVVFAGFIDGQPVFACGDGAVYRGDVPADGTPLRLAPHKGGLLTAVVMPDGKALVTAGDDGKLVRIAASGEPETLHEWPRKWIDQLTVGPAGALAFASGRAARVLTPQGKVIEHNEERAVGGLAFFPKGFRLALATYNGVRLIYPGTETAPQFLEWKGSHTGVVLSADARFLVTTMQEPAMHGWRLPENAHMRMSGYPTKVKKVSWSAKGRFLASSGANAAIVWPFHHKDGPMGKAPLELGQRADALVTSVACHPAEEIVAIGYEDGMILLVRFSDAEEVLLRRPSQSPISAMNWDAKGQRLAFGTEAGQAGVVDLTAA